MLSWAYWERFKHHLFLLCWVFRFCWSVFWPHHRLRRTEQNIKAEQVGLGSFWLKGGKSFMSSWSVELSVLMQQPLRVYLELYYMHSILRLDVDENLFSVFTCCKLWHYCYVENKKCRRFLLGFTCKYSVEKTLTCRPQELFDFKDEKDLLTNSSLEVTLYRCPC